MSQRMSQKKLILSYYMRHPNRDIKTHKVVDWALVEWQKMTGEPLRDPDRAIRSLYSDGVLVKKGKALYCYDPEAVKERKFREFTQQQKDEIFRRDDYSCVICGLGRAAGHEIHADHICSRQEGGESTIENGQTLCATHNFRKKAYSQTESGKRMHIRLYELAKKKGDKKTMAFCRALLEVYDEFGVNGHIEWKP